MDKRYRNLFKLLKEMSEVQVVGGPGVLVPENMQAQMLEDGIDRFAMEWDWNAGNVIFKRDGLDWITLPII